MPKTIASLDPKHFNIRILIKKNQIMVIIVDVLKNMFQLKPKNLKNISIIHILVSEAYDLIMLQTGINKSIAILELT